MISVDRWGNKIANIGDNLTAEFEIGSDAINASLFVLTIEKNDDQDDGPSAVHIVGGNYENGVTLATIDHAAALGDDFSSAAGTAIMAAPTGGDLNQGLWFVDSQAGSGSLELTELPTGWVYEGWLVNTSNGRKVSTGLFRVANQIDSDAAGPYAGRMKLDFPPVPGEDFVRTSLRLDDGIHAAVITVEPYPDYDSRPSDLKILKGDIMRGQEGGRSFDLVNISNGGPNVRALIHR